MNIISKINFQVSQIEKLLRKDLENGTITYNYHICEEKTKLLDRFALQTYITETKIENLTFLKSICQRCSNIVDLWHVDLKDLPNNLLKEQFVVNDTNGNFLLSTPLKFYAIYLTDERFNFYTTDLEKREFLKEYKYNDYQISEIINKCSLILNWITASFTMIDVDYRPKTYLNHYLQTGRFYFQGLVKYAYAKNEFKKFKKKLEKYIFRYNYIFKNLKESDKVEFKQDTLDELKKVNEAQEYSKYKVLIDDIVFELENDFQIISSKYQKKKNEFINNDGINQKNVLSELITHKEGEKIIDEIKIEYKNIKGKRLKLLLIAFQNLGLLPKGRFAKRFHECCKNEFEWNISSYNAMNGYSYNEHIDKEQLDSMIQYLEKFNKQQ